MKKINIYYILALLFAVSFTACDDTNENFVKERGVAVVPKITNLGPGFYTTDFENSYIMFDVDIPEGEQVDDAEIQATFKGETAMIQKISSFPVKQVKVAVSDVMSKLGLTESDVELGDTFIISVVTTANGVSTRSYTGSVSAIVTCELILEDFIGTNTVTEDEWSGEAPYDVEIIKVSDTELKVVGLFPSQISNPMIIKINPIDNSISIEKQVLVPLPTWWGAPGVPYKDFSLAGSGRIDACDIIISFSAAASVDAGSFAGTNAFTIKKMN